MTSYIDKKLKPKQPDTSLVYKDIEKWTLIDVALPGDQKVIRTADRVEMYHDLALEIKRIYRAPKVTVIPIVTVVLGTISKNYAQEKLGAWILVAISSPKPEVQRNEI